MNSASNLATIKSSNRSLILRTLNSLGEASRADLSRITGLTKTSITNITNELLKDGLIYETGTLDSSSGRKPILLNLSQDALYSIGVYISRDFAYTNMVNLKGEIVSECKYAFDLTESENTFISSIYRNIETIISNSQIDISKILGIGIASIGPLDIEKGIILDPPNFRGLKSIAIVSALKEKFDFNIFLDNDMNASAIAEKLFGKAKNVRNFVYVGITNGIGSGIIINSNIFRGNNGFAGEIGHTTINAHGERCACGNIGCLELYASIPNTISQVKTSISLGAESTISSVENPGWKDIVSAALQQDPLCLKAIDNLIYYVSIGLVNIINTFDPEIIYLGHEIAMAGNLITIPLNEIINKSFLSKSSKHVDIQLSTFKEYAPCIGAPSIVLSRFFNGETG